MLIRFLRWFIAGIVLVLVGYGAAGMVGGAIPINRDWRAPTRGIAIYVESNGVHTALILPKVAGGVDWRGLVDPRDLRDPRYAGYDHVAIGWGERRFFLDTPTWWDVRPATILAASIGSDATLIHVEHIPAPAATDPDARRIILTPAQYARLAAFIRASVAPGGRRYRGYFDNDAFYEARGHYDAVRTCNDWTGDALRHAGVRIGGWTPFAVTVMGWFPG
ncbi:TIGR02117 family protein [Sphingomonas oligophenolica]|nr:TIGR02117 family protein [Sphingomonas oligophenolica]